MNDVAMSFNDVLALTIVGMLWTWSPGKHQAIPFEVPQVSGNAAAVAASAPPLPLVVTAQGALQMEGKDASVDDVLAAVQAAPRALHVCAAPGVAWGVVADRIAQLQERWAFVQAGVVSQGGGR
jgi:hypothetical protein